MLSDIDKRYTVDGVVDHAKVEAAYNAIKLLAGDKDNLGEVETHHYDGDNMMFFYSVKDYREACSRGWEAVNGMSKHDREFPALVLQTYINAVDEYLFDNTYTEDPFQVEPEVYCMRKLLKD